MKGVFRAWTKAIDLKGIRKEVEDWVNETFELCDESVAELIRQVALEKLELTTENWSGGENYNRELSYYDMWPNRETFDVPEFDVQVTIDRKCNATISIRTTNILWNWLNDGTPPHSGRKDGKGPMRFIAQSNMRTEPNILETWEDVSYAGWVSTYHVKGIERRNWKKTVVKELQDEFSRDYPGLRIWLVK